MSLGASTMILIYHLSTFKSIFVLINVSTRRINTIIRQVGIDILGI